MDDWDVARDIELKREEEPVKSYRPVEVKKKASTFSQIKNPQPFFFLFEERIAIFAGNFNSLGSDIRKLAKQKTKYRPTYCLILLLQ